MSKPKSREEKPKETKTFFDTLEPVSEETGTFDVIAKIKSVTKENISELETYMNSDVKTVRKAAEKKMRELMDIKE